MLEMVVEHLVSAAARVLGTTVLLLGVESWAFRAANVVGIAARSTTIA